jgi:HAD superfamily hydrolase (TIGR01549 family)
MKKNAAVIFDCDGVMFDSRQANINFYNHLLERFDLPPMTEDQVAFVHMYTADESVRFIFEGSPYIEQAQKYRMEMDYTPFIKDLAMEAGLKELLRKLKPLCGLAVATNRSNTIGAVLESKILKDFFDIVISSLDVKNPKPDPEPLLKILDFFQLPPERSIYVGDSAIDYETARAADVPFVAFKNPELNARHHVDHLMDIAHLVNSAKSAKSGMSVKY